MWILFAMIAVVSVGTSLVLRRKVAAPSPSLWGPPPSRISVGPGEAHLALASQWGNFHAALAPMPGAEGKVAALERRYGISIPEDFRLYLLTTAPSGYYTDDIGTAWWTLDEIKSLADECGEAAPGDRRNPAVLAEENQYLVFADFLIWAHAWAICCSDGEHRGRIVLIDDGDRFVADSFAQFVEMELNDDHSIHPGPSGVRA